MKLDFHLNPAINLEEVKDSMQLDSGQTIAHLKVDNYDITLEVRGEVRVVWTPDPENEPDRSEVYKHASDFPDELMAVFASGEGTAEDPRIYVDDNNWFEIFIDKDGRNVQYDTADAEELNPQQVFSLLWDSFIEFRKLEEEEEREANDCGHADCL